MTDRLSVRLDSLFKLQQGKYLPPDAMMDEPSSESPYPVYGANGIIGYCDLPKYEDPRVLVSCRGANCGVVHLTVPHAWVSNNSIALEPLPEVPTDSSFVHALLRASSFLDVITGSAQPQITVSNLSRKEILVPLFEIQKMIGGIERLLSGLIAINRRRIEVLEETARLLYREWFVNFRYPGHEDVLLVDSELGPIPEGWEVTLAGDFVELAYGKGLKAEDRLGGDVPVFGSAGLVGWHDQSLVSGPGIVLGRKGNIGSAYWSEVDFFPIDTTFYVVSEFSMRFLFFYFENQDFVGGHAAVPGLSRDEVYARKLVLPRAEVVDLFSAKVEQLLSLANLLEGSVNGLIETRDLLLPRLVSGDLAISDLDLEAVG